MGVLLKCAHQAVLSSLHLIFRWLEGHNVWKLWAAEQVQTSATKLWGKKAHFLLHVTFFLITLFNSSDRENQDFLWCKHWFYGIKSKPRLSFILGNPGIKHDQKVLLPLEDESRNSQRTQSESSARVFSHIGKDITFSPFSHRLTLASLWSVTMETTSRWLIHWIPLIKLHFISVWKCLMWLSDMLT